MKPEQIFEAVSYADEELLLKSENIKETIGEETPDRHVKTNIMYWRRWGILAACACLVLVLFTVSPLRMIFFGGGSGSVMSSSEEAGLAAEDTLENENNEDNSTGETSIAWITFEGTDYQELTSDEINEYGISREELEDITASDIGEYVGTAEDASDESLMGADIYRAERYDTLFIVSTEKGYRYFRKDSQK